MTQYIDESALVAEIERLITELVEEGENTMFEQGRISALEDVKVFINHTIEVKEVKEEPESIWHDANKQPTMYRKYLVRYSDGRVSGSWERHDNGFIPWEDVIKEHGFTHWCYVEDLIKL